MTPRDKTPRSRNKTPAKRAAPTRSAGKTPARKPGRPYPAREREVALDTVAGHGIAEAHRRHGIPKPTLTRWAKAAGLDVGDQARRRTAAATDAVRARVAEVKLGTVDLLEQHIAQAGSYVATVAGVNALAAQLIATGDPDNINVAVSPFGRYAQLTGDLAELDKVALALAGLPLAPRDAEGILTRAIHDLQLLRGEATERGELVVEFNVPRPDPSTAPPPLEVPAIES